MKVGIYEANRDGLIADMFLEAIPDYNYDWMQTAVDR